MKTIFSFVKQNIYPILLFVIVLALLLTNYKPDTYLIGWDNFNSELSPWLAVKQAWNAGWSDFRSFGLPAGMAYATDLLRATFVWILSFILPQEIIRYVVQFSFLFIGGLGVFVFFSFLGFPAVFAFLGSLYYMLNYGTVQIFALPYEPFSAFFAFLPWALYSYLKALNHFNKKSIIKFLIIQALFTAGFYVQTGFVVYMMIWALVTIIYLLINKHCLFENIKKVIILAVVIFCVNSYWLLPQIYFVKTNIHTVKEAKQTIFGLGITQLNEKAHSTLPDFFKEKGSYSDFRGWDKNLIFSKWLNYFSLPQAQVLHVGISLIMILGLFAGKQKYKKYFFGILVLTAIVFLPDFPIFHQINVFLRNSKTLDQIFRSSFSKFVSPLSLVLAYFFVCGTQTITSWIKYQNIKKVILVGIIISLFFISYPSFQGYFLAKDMKIQIPEEYKELFNYFEKQDKNKRILLLPDSSFWGWSVYRWGYLGSGFLWHGIEQPIISRSYDVWSKTSENSHWELNIALMREDKTALKTTLEKYNISYLIVDQSYSMGNPKDLQIDRTIDMLNDISSIRQVAKFNFIEVYEYTGSNNSLFQLNTSLPNIGERVNSLYQDTAFQDHGNYKTEINEDFDYYYPFLSFQSFTDDSLKQWNIAENQDSFILSTKIPKGISEISKLVIPNNDKNYIFETVNNGKVFDLPISINKYNNTLQVNIPKIKIPKSNQSKYLSCNNNKTKTTQVLQSKHVQNGLQMIAKDGADGCMGITYNALPQKYSYLLKVKSNNIQGLPLSFSINDHTKKQNIIESRLHNSGSSYFFIPKKHDYGIGISIDFQNFSYKKTTSENILDDVSLFLFPENIIKNIKFEKQGTTLVKNITLPVLYQKVNSWTYSVSLPKISDNNTIIFFQAYDSGWKAYKVKNVNFFNSNFPFLFGKELKEHILINNWANGWKINPNDSNSNIIIMFLPQYLQYIGFALLIFPLLYILFKKK